MGYTAHTSIAGISLAYIVSLTHTYLVCAFLHSTSPHTYSPFLAVAVRVQQSFLHTSRVCPVGKSNANMCPHAFLRHRTAEVERDAYTLQRIALPWPPLVAAPYSFLAFRSCREFAKRLWGDLYFHPEERVFRRTPARSGGTGGSSERTFVQFVLEPLYKMYSTVIGEAMQSGRGCKPHGSNVFHLLTSFLATQSCSVQFDFLEPGLGLWLSPT